MALITQKKIIIALPILLGFSIAYSILSKSLNSLEGFPTKLKFNINYQSRIVENGNNAFRRVPISPSITTTATTTTTTTTIATAPQPPPPQSPPPRTTATPPQPPPSPLPRTTSTTPPTPQPPQSSQPRRRGTTTTTTTTPPPPPPPPPPPTTRSSEKSCKDIDFKVAANYSTESYCLRKTCGAYFFPTVEENAQYLMQFMRKNIITRTYRRFLSGGMYLSGSRSPKTVLVNAHSSNHYFEFRKMLDVTNKTFGNTYKLVVYDLGLSKKQADFIMLQEYQYVIWMDTSIRFKTSNISDLLHHAKVHYIAVTGHQLPETCATHPEMFAFFHEDVCLFCEAQQIQGGFFVMHSSELTRNVLSYAWALCALDRNCMNPPDTRITVKGCRFEKSPHFCDCSRFDQSALTMLLFRLFAKTRTPLPVAGPWLYVTWPSVLSIEKMV